MKKYLGSSITAYAAIVMPLFILFPLLFGISSLYSEVEDEEKEMEAEKEG